MISRRQMLYLLSATSVTSLAAAQSKALQDQSHAPALSSRPRFHVAPPSGWINDPQRPMWLNNSWTLWVLYNADYPNGNGTAWRRYTSADLVDWYDRGISIPKYTNQYGDVWTGGTVVDLNNTAGYGARALIALMTMPCNTASGQQNQSTALWYSKDDGKTFTFGSIVQPNYPGNNAVFRDPSVFWHAPTERWVMSLAESNKLNVYTSSDMKNWSYASRLMCGDLGLMECPNLFPIPLHDERDREVCEKWVLLCGANGYLTGFTTGTYYWIGTFDGITFTPDAGSGKWLDSGSDFYACTVCAHYNACGQDPHVYAIAWMNNWDYATKVPTTGYFGQLSVTRVLRLKIVNGSPLLLNAPVDDLDQLFTSLSRGTDQTISDPTDYSFPNWENTPACRIDFALSANNGVWPAAIFFSMRGGDGYFTQLTFDCGKSNIFFKRDTSGPQPTSDSNWVANRNAAFSFTVKPVSVTVLIDVNSVEVFINQGEISMSSLITAPLDGTALNMSVAGGSARVVGLTIRSVA